MTHHMTTRNMVHEFHGTDDMHELIISNEDIFSLFNEKMSQYDCTVGIMRGYPRSRLHHVLMINPKTGDIINFDFFEIDDNDDIVFYNGWRNNEFLGHGNNIQTYHARYMGRYKS